MSLKIDFHDSGYCTHLERMVMKGGRFQSKKFPSMFAHIYHPMHGHILYDTGYSSHMMDATKQFPEVLYAKMTPVFVNEMDLAKTKLKNEGINPEDVNYIIISHFHADHISALKDFPKAKFIYLKSAFDRISKMSKIPALLNAFLPALLPSDFLERSITIESNLTDSKVNATIKKYFEWTYDIFGDGSLVAVKLEGHTESQIGLYMRDYTGQEKFLIADSCWSSSQFRDYKLPLPIVRIITFNFNEYKNTLFKLHKIYHEDKNLQIIPSHCGEFHRDHVHTCQFSKEGLNSV